MAGGPLQLSTLVSSRANCPFGCVSRPRLHLGRKRSRREGPELSSEILALASQRQRRPSPKSSEIRYWPRFVPTAPRGENQFPVSSRQPSIINTPMAHLRPYPLHQSYHCIRSVRSIRAYINVSRSSQKQTRPPLMYIRTVVSLGASLRFGLCVRSSSGFKVRVEVGVILFLTAGPNRRALGYCSNYRSI